MISNTRKTDTVLSASRSGYFQFCLILFLIAIFSRQINWCVSQSIKTKNNFSTCKWYIWWCHWNNWFPSYFNPSEKERALNKTKCLSVRFFIVPSALIIHKLCTVSSRFSQLYFFGVIQGKQQVVFAFFCKTRLRPSIDASNRILWSRLVFKWEYLSHFQKRFIFLSSKTVICKSRFNSSLFFFSVSSYLLTLFIVCFRLCRRIFRVDNNG